MLKMIKKLRLFYKNIDINIVSKIILKKNDWKENPILLLYQTK